MSLPCSLLTFPAMLSDRPSLRGDYQTERTSFLLWLLSAVIAGFVVQNIFGLWFKSTAFEQLCALSASSPGQGALWTLVSYPLVHRNVLHLFLVMFGVFFLGRELLPIIGERRLAGLTATAVVGAALLWFAVNVGHDGNVMGASPILCCYLIVFACFYPNREISFLFFFLFPVTTRPKYLAWLAVGIDVLGFILSETPAGTLDTGVPHSAHLGAMAAGWLYFRYVHESDRNGFNRRVAVGLPPWLKRSSKPPVTLPPAHAPAPRLVPNDRAGLRAEVDRILDKINSHGFGALTVAEKRVLDEAKDLLSRP